MLKPLVLSFSTLILSTYASPGPEVHLLEKRQQSEFQTCITNSTGAKNIVVTTASSSGYADESKAFNLRIQLAPKAIVYPTSVQEVADVVKCASHQNMTVSSRSGGHSYAAYGLSGDIVVDLSKLKQLQVNQDGTAVVQTGNKLGDLALALWNQGRRALPHGTCPYVGTGGHAAYGGYGFFSRVGGLLLDNIVAAQVVLANGTIFNATTSENADLFWAVRGAGPSFGVVTSWTFKTYQAPTTVMDFEISFDSVTEQSLTNALISYQEWQKAAPKEMTVEVVIGPDSGNLYLSFGGDYYGSADDFHKLIDPWVQSLPGGPSLRAKEVDWMGSLVSKDGNLNTAGPDTHDTFFAKSLLVPQPSSNESLTAWSKFIFSTGLQSGIEWFAIVDPWGGQIASVDKNATSFAHRDAQFGYQLYSYSKGMVPPYPDANIQFVNDMWTTLAGTDKKLPQYINYIDPTLDSDSWPSAYYGGSFDRLTQLKRVYDPNNTFKNNQSIPVGTSSQSTQGSGSIRLATPAWMMLVLGGLTAANLL